MARIDALKAKIELSGNMITASMLAGLIAFVWLLFNYESLTIWAITYGIIILLVSPIMAYHFRSRQKNYLNELDEL